LDIIISFFYTTEIFKFKVKSLKLRVNGLVFSRQTINFLLSTFNFNYIHRSTTITVSGHIFAHAAQPMQSGRSCAAGLYPFEFIVSLSKPKTFLGQTVMQMPQPLHFSALIFTDANYIILSNVSKTVISRRGKSINGDYITHGLFGQSRL
jgi:hypothetical protein